MTDTGGMSSPRSIRSIRNALVAAAGAGLLAGAAPAAALAGGGDRPAKPPKCDPTVQVCDSGRKNG